MVWFSERKELEKQYYEWIKENGIADQPNSVVAFLEINGLLNDKKVHEKAGIVKPQPKTNYDNITESVESLAEFVYKVRFNCALSDYGCDYCLLKELGDSNKTNIKEWLQKECEDDTTANL